MEGIAQQSQKLILFHQAKEAEQKRKIAQELVDTHPKSQDYSIKKLIFQMKLFLNPDYGKMYNFNPKEQKYANAEDFYAHAEFSLEELSNFIPSITIDHIFKIFTSLNVNKIDKALRNYKKLPLSIKNSISSFIDIHQVENSKYRWMEKGLTHLAIGYFKKAQTNGKTALAEKLQRQLEENGMLDIVVD